jgi:hypothetical protein
MRATLRSGPARDSLPELVLLLQEPLIADASFLRSAYQAVLGLKLESDTEFVTGQFRIFGFQTAGVLVSVTMSDGSTAIKPIRRHFRITILSVRFGVHLAFVIVAESPGIRAGSVLVYYARSHRPTWSRMFTWVALCAPLHYQGQLLVSSHRGWGRLRFL